MSFLQKISALLRQLQGAKQVGLPVITTSELAQARNNDWEYLRVILDAYEKSVHPKFLWNELASFSEEPIKLILYSGLCDQVNNGGFIQLIQNGYGSNLFNNPFAEDLAAWGAIELAEIVHQANAIYQANRKYLEHERSIANFSALYKEFRAFELLENRFYVAEEAQTAIVRAYVEQHLNQFAIVI